jgi:hypothetical protein
VLDVQSLYGLKWSHAGPTSHGCSLLPYAEVPVLWELNELALSSAEGTLEVPMLPHACPAVHIDKVHFLTMLKGRDDLS